MFIKYIEESSCAARVHKIRVSWSLPHSHYSMYCFMVGQSISQPEAISDSAFPPLQIKRRVSCYRAKYKDIK